MVYETTGIHRSMEASKQYLHISYDTQVQVMMKSELNN